MTKIFDFVFVVLVYKNTQDLEDFFAMLSLKNVKVVVVNSFYNIDSEKIFSELAKNNNADFISIPNNGYGFGNNRGCEYVLNKYQFKYLIISNADIIIKSLTIDMLNGYSDCITAPDIRTLTGKRQNPYLAYRLKFFDKIKVLSLKNDYKWLLFISSIISRIERETYLLLHKLKLTRTNIIYACHGAFIILPKQIVAKLYPLYNEKMFLFEEEEHIAELIRTHGIKARYNPAISIIHKEDGSMSISDINFYMTRKNSFLEYYKYWHSRQNL